MLTIRQIANLVGKSTPPIRLREVAQALHLSGPFSFRQLAEMAGGRRVIAVLAIRHIAPIDAKKATSREDFLRLFNTAPGITTKELIKFKKTVNDVGINLVFASVDHRRVVLSGEVNAFGRLTVLSDPNGVDAGSPATSEDEATWHALIASGANPVNPAFGGPYPDVGSFGANDPFLPLLNEILKVFGIDPPGTVTLSETTIYGNVEEVPEIDFSNPPSNDIGDGGLPPGGLEDGEPP